MERKINLIFPNKKSITVDFMPQMGEVIVLSDVDCGKVTGITTILERQFGTKNPAAKNLQYYYLATTTVELSKLDA